jgi:hypothetical protein
LMSFCEANNYLRLIGDVGGEGRDTGGWNAPR